MNNTYLNRSRRLEMADRKLRHMISRASSYLREYEEFQDYADMLPDEDCSMQEMAGLYKALANAEIEAAKTLVWYLEDVSEIDFDDWHTINTILNWFGTPAEDRSDDCINWLQMLDHIALEIGGSR